MTAYYNEYDAFAAATLRELIADGLIAPGIVDERSIELVQPADLKGFTQVHLFAGFGIWSAAARLVGWRDDRPLWSASCPCPPFSSAGKVKACGQCGGFKPIPHVRRTGVFLCSLCGHQWLADQRHLWPEVWRLVRDERPPCIVGEQVASADGRTWLDLVRASLEILAYDAWGVDTCAAGFGAPHIRQRLYWVADTENPDGGRRERPAQERVGQNEQRRGRPASSGAACRLDDTTGSRLARTISEAEGHPWSEAWMRQLDAGRPAGWLGDSDGQLSGDSGAIQASREQRFPPGQRRKAQGNHEPNPTNGLWRDADWLGCTDGRFRPVEPSTFPLAPARTFRNRLAELRGAGNAVNLAQAAGFLRAIMSELPGADL